MASNWSFRARLHNASSAMKERYLMLLDELATYKKVRTVESWKKVRVCHGRQTFGVIFFRGKTLCMTLALNPADFAETEFVFTDVSDVKRYANTPMMVRLSSDKRLRQLRELIYRMFKGIDIISADPIAEREIPFYDKHELVEMGLIKVTANEHHHHHHHHHKLAHHHHVEKHESAEPAAEVIEEPVHEEPVEEPIVEEEPVVVEEEPVEEAPIEEEQVEEPIEEPIEESPVEEPVEETVEEEPVVVEEEPVEEAPIEEEQIEEPTEEPIEEPIEESPVEEPVEEIPVEEEPVVVEEPKPEPEPEPQPAPAPAPAPQPKPKPKKAHSKKSLPAHYDIPESAKASPKGIVNIGSINSHFEDGDTVTPQALKDRGLLEKKVNFLKVLGGGHLEKSLTIAASAFAEDAKEAILAAGGKVVVIPTE